MPKASVNEKRKWLTLVVLALAGGVIYELPYLRYTYYTPLLEGLKFTNEQFGRLMSMYGFIAMIFYLPSGWLADRFSHRKLLTFSLVGTGLGGFYLSIWPSYTGSIVLFGFWGITTILTFWSTMLKAISLLGDESEQGRLFSFAEGGRGIATSALAISSLFLFNMLGGLTENFTYILWLYSIVCIAVGVAAWVLMIDNKPSENTSVNVIKDLLLIIKMPVVWLLCLVIFFIYTTCTSSSYLTPYMTDVFGLSAVAAGVVATIRTHIFRPFAGMVGGTASKKMGSSIPVMLAVIVVIIVALVIIAFVPPAQSLVLPISLVTIVISFSIFILRGLYFAPVGEVNTPVELMGSAVGLISTVAFASDIFNFKFIGSILDNNTPEMGYKLIFLYMIVLLVVSFRSCLSFG